jgi:hypothetical protein
VPDFDFDNGPSYEQLLMEALHYAEEVTHAALLLSR